jgi:hypothetical protein
VPSPPTPRLGLVKPVGATDDLRDGDNVISAAIDRLDTVLAPNDRGTLANRPVSTGATPGIAGRRYYATDAVLGGVTGVEYLDIGTAWIALARADDTRLVRTVRGRVDSGAGIIDGFGFTVARVGSVGGYRITFSTAFVGGAAPIITASVEQTKGACHVVNPTTSSFDLLTFNPQGVEADRRFGFVATAIIT